MGKLLPVVSVSAVFLVTILLISFLALNVQFQSNNDAPIDLNDNIPTRIAIIDSGCSNDQSYVEVFKNFVTLDNNYLYGELQPYDGVGHGEFVCDLVHQYAPKARIFSAKIASSTGEITFKGFFEAIKWAAEVIKAHVINISIGTLPILSPDLQDAITKYVEEQGIVFSVSAGNDGTVSTDSIGLGEWPAILPSTIGVGAINLKDNESYSFSSWGRNIYGTYTVDFVADGSPPADKFLRGTSFSTPIITGLISNYREFLIENKIEPFPRIIQGLMIQYSDGYSKGKFDEKLGWGQIRNINEAPLPIGWESFLNKTYIFGGLPDSIPRFRGENFTISWKFVTTYQDDYTPSFTLNGNASSLTNLTISSISSWGGVLSANIKIPYNTDDGWYSLSIEPEQGLGITYSFQVKGDYEKNILLDNSLSVNGLNFEYGQLWDLNLGMRDNGFLPEFNQDPISSEKMKIYDAIVLLQPGSTSEGDSVTIFDNFNSTRFRSYIDYAKSGGNLFVLFDDSIDSNIESINNELNDLDVNLDRQFAEGNSPLTVTDLNQHPVTDGVSSILASGYAIETDSSNYVEFGHVTYTVTDLLGSYTVTSSVGIVGGVNSGKIIIFSGYSSLTNEKISSPTELGSGTFRMFINSLNWLTS